MEGRALGKSSTTPHQPSPVQQRQTRNKTRVAAIEESAAIAKLSTQNLVDIRSNTKGTDKTPMSLKAAAIRNQVSKLAHVNRTASTSNIAQKSRESSTEDARRGTVINTFFKVSLQVGSNYL